MATPTATGIIGHFGGSSPTDAKLPADTDGVQGLRVTLVLHGSAANLATDWATLIAQNFASSSAIASWDRAD